MKFIDLDELDKRIKAMYKPTPFHVLELIAIMNRGMK